MWHVGNMKTCIERFCGSSTYLASIKCGLLFRTESIILHLIICCSFHYLLTFFNRLEVAIETIFDKAVGSEIPMLSIIDDGVGMNHQDILRMISFGHKVPDDDNQDRVGRFGVGFKVLSSDLETAVCSIYQTRSIFC